MFYNERLEKKLRKKNNKLAFLITVASVLLMVGVLLTSPSLTAFAQASSLTPEEQQIQNDISETQNIALNTLAAVDANQNTDDFRSRWSPVTWIEPGDITAIFVDCEPGEYPQGAQEIFSSPRLELIASFAVGINQNVYSWLAVVQNEDEQQRHAAAIGVICEGDTDESKRVSNTIYSFDIDETNIINNIKQIINIKKNVTVIAPTNNNTNTGGGGNTTNPGGNTTDPGTESPVTNGTSPGVTEPSTTTGSNVTATEGEGGTGTAATSPPPEETAATSPPPEEEAEEEEATPPSDDDDGGEEGTADDDAGGGATT